MPVLQFLVVLQNLSLEHNHIYRHASGVIIRFKLRKYTIEIFRQYINQQRLNGNHGERNQVLRRTWCKAHRQRQ